MNIQELKKNNDSLLEWSLMKEVNIFYSVQSERWGDTVGGMIIDEWIIRETEMLEWINRIQEASATTSNHSIHSVSSSTFSLYYSLPPLPLPPLPLSPPLLLLSLPSLMHILNTCDDLPESLLSFDYSSSLSPLFLFSLFTPSFNSSRLWEWIDEKSPSLSFFPSPLFTSLHLMRGCHKYLPFPSFLPPL